MRYAKNAELRVGKCKPSLILAGSETPPLSTIYTLVVDGERYVTVQGLEDPPLDPKAYLTIAEVFAREMVRKDISHYKVLNGEPIIDDEFVVIGKIDSTTLDRLVDAIDERKKDIYFLRLVPMSEVNNNL